MNGFGVELVVDRAVMHVDPSLPYARHSLFRQPAVVQRSLNDAGSSHPPVTASATAGFVHLRRMDAQPDEMSPPCARPFPLLPVAQAHAPPQPLSSPGIMR